MRTHRNSKSRYQNPQKPTQSSPKSSPRHLVGKRTAQRDINKDITSDSQVNSYFPYRWSPASRTLNSRSNRNPPVKPRWTRPKTTRNGCQSPTARVVLKLGLGWYFLLSRSFNLKANLPSCNLRGKQSCQF